MTVETRMENSNHFDFRVTNAKWRDEKHRRNQKNRRRSSIRSVSRSPVGHRRRFSRANRKSRSRSISIPLRRSRSRSFSGSLKGSSRRQRSPSPPPFSRKGSYTSPPSRSRRRGYEKYDSSIEENRRRNNCYDNVDDRRGRSYRQQQKLYPPRQNNRNHFQKHENMMSHRFSGREFYSYHENKGGMSERRNLRIRRSTSRDNLGAFNEYSMGVQLRSVVKIPNNGRDQRWISDERYHHSRHGGHDDHMRVKTKEDGSERDGKNEKPNRKRSCSIEGDDRDYRHKKPKVEITEGVVPQAERVVEDQDRIPAETREDIIDEAAFEPDYEE